MTLLNDVYTRLPTPLQHAAISAFGAVWYYKRFTGTYPTEKARFVERMRWTREQFREYQTLALRRILHAAVQTVPFYRDIEQTYKNTHPHDARLAPFLIYAELRKNPHLIDTFTLNDLVRLPVLPKDFVRANPDAFCLDGVMPKDATICPTSGSTGTPVRAYFTKADFRRSLALREVRECMSVGVSYTMPRATFSGRVVVPEPPGKPPYYRYNAVEKQVYYSAFHLAPQNAWSYVEALHRHKTVWATGYTHAFVTLGQYILEQNLPKPPHMKAIITTSEKLTPDARATIEAAFGCPVYEEYGQVEDAVFASTFVHPCLPEQGARMYQSPDAGIAECVQVSDDGFGIPVADGEMGRVLGTTFTRRSQLLIRYQIGDLARMSFHTPEAAYMPVVHEIVGRMEDIIIAPDGRKMAWFYGVFTEVKTIREAQIIQDRIDHVTVKVVLAPHTHIHTNMHTNTNLQNNQQDTIKRETIQEVTARIHLRLSPQMQVSVEFVDHIPRNKSGKFRAVIGLGQPKPESQTY